MNFVLKVTREQLLGFESLLDTSLRSEGLSSLAKCVDLLNVLRAATPEKTEEPKADEEKKD